MYKQSKLAGVFVSAFCLAAMLGAQELTTALSPSFSGTVGLQVGAQNLEGNPEIAKIPGVSSANDTVLDFTVQGLVLLPALRLEQEQDSIERIEGLGYEAGIKTNLAQLYSFTQSSSAYSLNSDSSGYSRVQLMIDWYEANKTRFGLPSNPFGATGWPTTSYGMSGGRYQFIIGTRAERADDIAWTSTRWDEAYALYQDIKAKITIAIDSLYASVPLSTGDVNQYIYAGLSAENQKLASLKQQAIRSFASVSSLSTAFAANGPLVSSAWLKFTNIGGLLDARVDFVGQKLALGNMLKSSLSTQASTGSALTLGLNRRVIPGLSASLATSCVGGTNQTPENYDTVALDYFPGLVAEIGVQAKIAYLMYFTSLNGELSLGAEALMPDLLGETLNMAAGGQVSWKSNNNLSIETICEGQFVYWADRLVLSDVATPSFAIANRTVVDYLGLGMNANVRFKDALFSQRNKNTVEDRFMGISSLSDFEAASLQSGLWWSAGVSFDPTAIIGVNLVRLDIGVDQFLYSSSFTSQGLGCNATLKFDLLDTINLPINLSASASWYRNDMLPVYSDMSSLPVRSLIDDLTYSATLKMAPLSGLGLELVFTSKPFSSKRQTIRDSSLLFSAKIKL